MKAGKLPIIYPIDIKISDLRNGIDGPYTILAGSQRVTLEKPNSFGPLLAPILMNLSSIHQIYGCLSLTEVLSLRTGHHVEAHAATGISLPRCPPNYACDCLLGLLESQL